MHTHTPSIQTMHFIHTSLPRKICFQTVRTPARYTPVCNSRQTLHTFFLCGLSSKY